MDYSLRTEAVTVALCNGTCNTAADADDGDPRATAMQRTGSGATSAATSTIKIATITATGFTASSVSNNLTLSTCANSAANGTFPIVEFVNATTVKVDVTAVSGFGVDMTCAFSEAIPGAAARTGTGASAAAPVTVKEVSGLPTTLTTRPLGKTLQLTATASSTGTAPVNSDDGTYPVVGSPSAGVLAIDTSASMTYAGGITALDWVLSSAEHDNVQCPHVIGSTKGDTLSGDDRTNLIHGGEGADTLNGLDGNDNLYGDDGADSVYGGDGDDTLIGGAGDDGLIGGDGNDLLIGDDGQDIFTCDGKNTAASAAVGTSPGENDFRVDFTVAAGANQDALGASHGCEF
jgi:Ca2+-binding RTX toxin-like protein